MLILFTLALTWVAVIAGLSAKTVDGASAFSYPLIFLPFISSAFVPTDTMPGPVRLVRREPAGDPDRQHDPRTFAQQPVGDDIWIALAWCLGILDRRVRRRDGDLPSQDQLSPPRHRAVRPPPRRLTGRSVAVCQNPGVPTLADLVRDDHRAALLDLQRRGLPQVEVEIPPTEELVTRALEAAVASTISIPCSRPPIGCGQGRARTFSAWRCPRSLPRWAARTRCPICRRSRRTPSIRPAMSACWWPC